MNIEKTTERYRVLAVDGGRFIVIDTHRLGIFRTSFPGTLAEATRWAANQNQDSQRHGNS